MAITLQTDSAGNLIATTNPPTGAAATQQQGTTAPGGILIGNPLPAAANADGANGGTGRVQQLVADAAQALKVNPEGQKATYTAAFSVTPAASATDIAQLIGSASAVVKLTRVAVSGIANAAAVIDVLGLKRSAADAGGTITAQGAVNHDKNDNAASAVCSAITANPTTLGATGAKYGTVRYGKLALEQAGLGVVPNQLIWEFGKNSEKGLTLRGAADAFCLNLNGVQSAGEALDVEITWTEE